VRDECAAAGRQRGRSWLRGQAEEFAVATVLGGQGLQAFGL